MTHNSTMISHPFVGLLIHSPARGASPASPEILIQISNDDFLDDWLENGLRFRFGGLSEVVHREKGEMK